MDRSPDRKCRLYDKGEGWESPVRRSQVLGVLENRNGTGVAEMSVREVTWEDSSGDSRVEKGPVI